MKKLYQHQQHIINVDPKKTGIFIGTGGGKSLIGLRLARGRILVICPKTQKEDQNWEREMLDNDMSLNITVMSKETFRRDHKKLGKFDTVIVDEAHTCLGVMPSFRWKKGKQIPRASQLFDGLQEFLLRTKPERLYLVTATIMRSPMTVWAAAQLIGYPLSFYMFRSKFYFKLPMPGRDIWAPKADDKTKDELAELVRAIGYVGRLEDFFDVPDQTHKTISIELSKQQSRRIKEMSLEFPEPIVRVGKIHQIENGILSGDEFSKGEIFENEKIERIKEYADEFPRLVVIAKYRAQIEEIKNALERDGKYVLTLTGDTKNRQEVLRWANESKRCVFIAQAQISTGWELPEYPCMIFASKTYSFVDYEQSLGRVQRVNNIKKNLYIHLVTKGVDQAVQDCVEQKKDFNERIYLNV